MIKNEKILIEYRKFGIKYLSKMDIVGKGERTND